MTRAPRRLPAVAALADLRAWKARWAVGQSIAETEAVIATEAWLRRIAMVQPARPPKPPT